MRLLDFRTFIIKHIRSIADIKPLNFLRLIKFYGSYIKYRRLSNASKLRTLDLYPCLNDDTPASFFDVHYFYQGVWAFKLIKKSGIKDHVDVGSEIKIGRAHV